MALLRIKNVSPAGGFRLRLTLSDDSLIERDVARLLTGPVFEPIRNDRGVFEQVRAEGGSIAWPNGADLCPDVLIWNGLPPLNGERPPPFQVLDMPA